METLEKLTNTNNTMIEDISIESTLDALHALSSVLTDKANKLATNLDLKIDARFVVEMFKYLDDNLYAELYSFIKTIAVKAVEEADKNAKTELCNIIYNKTKVYENHHCLPTELRCLIAPMVTTVFNTVYGTEFKKLNLGF